MTSANNHDSQRLCDLIAEYCDGTIAPEARRRTRQHSARGRNCATDLCGVRGHPPPPAPQTYTA